MAENSPPFRLHAIHGMHVLLFLVFHFFVTVFGDLRSSLSHHRYITTIRLPDYSIRTEVLLFRFTFVPILTAPLVSHGAVPIDILYIASIRQYIANAIVAPCVAYIFLRCRQTGSPRHRMLHGTKHRRRLPRDRPPAKRPRPPGRSRQQRPGCSCYCRSCSHQYSRPCCCTWSRCCRWTICATE